MDYRQTIQIDSNATEILKLPCVIGCQKEFWSDSDIRLRFDLFGDTQSTKFCWGENIYAYEGDWLCEDENEQGQLDLLERLMHTEWTYIFDVIGEQYKRLTHD